MDLNTIKSIRILYVEDENELRENVVANLSPFVKKIVTAENGKEGLDLYRSIRDQIDIIITDIMMPQINGVEMVDSIRKIDKEIPVIYTTAFDESSLIMQTIKQSISGYVLKPIDIEELIESIERAYVSVENRNLRKKLENINEYLRQEVEKKTENLLYLLNTDTLTGLPNRNALYQDIKKLSYPVVAIFDIDSFKSINDIYGIETGNIILQTFAKYLKDRQNEMGGKFYRTGSDDFVFLKEVTDKENCLKKIKNLISQINNEKIYLENYDVDIFIDVTVGVAFGKNNLLEKADMALKKALDKRISYYTLEDDETIQNEYKNYIEWIKILKNSISNKYIAPFFQPIVDRNGEIQSYEALIRIKDANTIYFPREFLEIAQKAKLYPSLAKIMIEESFKAAEEHKKTVGVNLSYLDIASTEMIEFIANRLNNYDIGSNIIFEITEDESIKDFKKVYRFISKVKSLGAKIAIDDFGSGYSNFIYLLKLQPDFIKIDGSIIKEIDKDKGALTIAKNIAEFSKELGIKTVAEYIHSKEVFEIAKSLGIEKFQGFYFSEAKEIME